MVAYFAWMQLGLGDKLRELGFNGVDIAAAIGNIIGRMVHRAANCNPTDGSGSKVVWEKSSTMPIAIWR